MIMSSTSISEELRQALTRLAQEKDPDPLLLERIARWRRSCDVLTSLMLVKAPFSK